MQAKLSRSLDLSAVCSGTRQWCCVGKQRLIGQISYHPGSDPGVQIVALVPIHAIELLAAGSSRNGQVSYNDFRPATRGTVAQEPPRTMLCFPSKKSASRISVCGKIHRIEQHTNLCNQDTATWPQIRPTSPMSNWSTPKHLPSVTGQPADRCP